MEVFEDEMFQFKLSAEDSEDKNLSFLANEIAPASMGNVSLALDGMLTYTPCAELLQGTKDGRGASTLC